MLIKLWQRFSGRRQKQFILLLFLMLIASVSEVVSIGAVLPFLGVLTAPDLVYEHELMQPLIHQLGMTDPDQLVFPITVVFIAVVIMASAIRLALLYVMTKLSFAAGADLSNEIYRRTLYQSYSIHVSRNSSEVINGIVIKTNQTIQVIQSSLMLISSLILLLSIMILLFKINVEVALVASIGFGMVYWGIIYYVREKLRVNSQCIADQSSKMIKALQEGLGGIRDILIDGSQSFYCMAYKNADLPFRKASGANAFISASPRYIVEGIGMSLIAGLAYVMTLDENGIDTAIPVLGAFALGAQRLLPALQQAYSSYSGIKSGKASLKDVLQLLDQPLPNYIIQQSSGEGLAFKSNIELKNISFKYENNEKWVLKDVSLKISKGECVGLIGVTGSGKSTLLDIFMGLLVQTEGEFTIDDLPINDKNRKAWQSNIAHVPQRIYLSDSTVEENIAFGVPREQISHDRVVKAAQQAQISEDIDRWQEGYRTFVGEQGVRLSGGQQQRIGIARALYKQANVLIFDEATSALDNETERAVMEAIEGLDENLTILIIAHRLSTLKKCDQIVKLDNDSISIGSYQELINIES